MGDKISRLCTFKGHFDMMGHRPESLAPIYSIFTGKLKRRFYLEGHVGWITSIEITDTMVISGSKAGQRVNNFKNENNGVIRRISLLW